MILNPGHLIDGFDGTVLFTAKGTKVSGTFAGSAQLQGSLDGTNWTAIGSAVVMADTVQSAIPLGGTILYYKFYRVLITGSGTQSTTVIGSYVAKGRD